MSTALSIGTDNIMSNMYVCGHHHYSVFIIDEFLHIYTNLMHNSTPFKTIQNKLCPLRLHQRQPHRAFRKHGNNWEIKGRKTCRKRSQLEGAPWGVLAFTAHATDEPVTEMPEREEQYGVLETLVKIWRKRKPLKFSSTPGVSIIKMPKSVK